MIHCDIRLCVGCRMCEVSCSSNHFGAVSPALSRIRVAKLDEIGIDMAVACFSCVEKPCLACPTEALSVGTQGVVLLDPDGNPNQRRAHFVGVLAEPLRKEWSEGRRVDS